MILTGLARLGRDCEIKYLSDGTAVANLAIVFNYGRKGDDGNRPSQWIDAALFGKRAKSLAPYLLKGGLLDVVLQEPHIETFQRNDGSTGSKLVARVLDIELAGGGQSSQPAQPQQQTRQQAPTQQAPRDNFDDYNDDIPF